ncbi:MAG: peptide chain release factor N(5)-glutamine methyltransferase [Methylophilaceae bacterium]
MDSIGSYKKKIAQALSEKINLTLREAELEAQFIMQYVLKQSPSNLIIKKNEIVLKKDISTIENIIRQRLDDLPLAYILKEWDFYGHTFQVSRDTLIPRQDTELLIDIILQNYDLNSPLKILDLGTGTGIIGITLAKNFKKSNVLLTDISIKAIEVAKKNIEANCLQNIHCVHSNWFENIDNLVFDIIVSNPPYISIEDPHLKQPELTKQPQVALVSHDEGLQDIRTIVGNASEYLSKTGMLLIENGYNQANKVKQIFTDNKFNQIDQYKDINNKIRVTTGIKI